MRKIVLFAAAASLSLGLAAVASAQQNGPPPQGAGQAGPPRGSAAASVTPAQDEEKLRREHPELYVVPPVSHRYQPKRTAWGDPDLRGMWPIDSIGGLPLQRQPAMGERFLLSPDELKAREAQMQRLRDAPAKETKAGKLGRSSWVPNQSYDWVTDFDTWDRCITRGFPASMLPFRYNNGVQILQSPGYVVINLEMIHDARIIPLDGRGKLPAGVTDWMGSSRGHWEGNTLVVDTDHIRPGASPLNAATIGGPQPAWNTIPMSPQAHVTERFTPIDPNHIVYEMSYSDPVNWTAPFTLRMTWTRNEKYKFFEYACHEGDVQVANYVKADHVKREKAKAAEKTAATGAPAAG